MPDLKPRIHEPIVISSSHVLPWIFGIFLIVLGAVQFLNGFVPILGDFPLVGLIPSWVFAGTGAFILAMQVYRTLTIDDTDRFVRRRTRILWYVRERTTPFSEVERVELKSHELHEKTREGRETTRVVYAVSMILKAGDRISVLSGGHESLMRSRAAELARRIGCTFDDRTPGVWGIVGALLERLP